jgi:hypothetical protein
MLWPVVNLSHSLFEPIGCCGLTLLECVNTSGSLSSGSDEGGLSPKSGAQEPKKDEAEKRMITK